MKLYLFNPDTLEYWGEFEIESEIPFNSTTIAPYVGFEAPQYFVNGLWTFDNPFTPDIETQYPIFDIESISLSPGNQGGTGIWNIKTETVVTLTASTVIQNGTFTAIVNRVVKGNEIEDIRFDAVIVDGVVNLPLYFKDSGNYYIKAERLNEGLAEIQEPFRVNFPTVDINVTVKIPT